jgi:phosphate-selective porin OprO and OprP
MTTMKNIALSLCFALLVLPGRTAGQANAGKDGFSLRSADGNFQLRLRGYVQFDGRFFQSDDQRPATDTFVLRRVRPIFEGTLYKIFDFRLMPDFGLGQTVLQDAYLEARFTPAFKVRAGKFKPPVGLERLQSATDLVFVERALPTNLVPNRDLGIQLGGDLAGGAATYAVGVFNGVVDGGNADADTNDAKDYAARVFFQPFAKGKGPLKNLGFGIAGSTGKQEGTATAPNLPSYRTPGQQTFFSYRADGTAPDTVIADGDRTRFSPQAYLYTGPFGLLAEYVTSKQAVRRGTVTRDLEHKAWQVAASWVLAGGQPTYRSVNPKTVFDPQAGTWGAFEIAARYHQQELDEATFPVFANPASSASEATAWAVGFNWYLNRNLRLLFDYEDTSFTGGAATGDREDEKIFFSRFQISF